MDSGIDQVLDDSADLLGVVLDTDDVLAFLHNKIELLVVLGIVLGHAVDLCKLADGLKELISRASQLWFEKSKPEQLSINIGREDLADLTLKVGVYDVLHIN